MSKKVVIDGVEIILVRRVCNNRKCNREFMVMQKSHQKICSIACFEIAYHTKWSKRPGAKSNAGTNQGLFKIDENQRQRAVKQAKARKAKYTGQNAVH